jgi:hypothetical protein
MSRAIYYDVYSPRQARLRIQWANASKKYYKANKKIIKARRESVN